MQVPILALVGNDAGWTQIEREQVPLFGSNVACGLEFTGKCELCAWLKKGLKKSFINSLASFGQVVHGPSYFLKSKFYWYLKFVHHNAINPLFYSFLWERFSVRIEASVL